MRRYLPTVLYWGLNISLGISQKQNGGFLDVIEALVNRLRGQRQVTGSKNRNVIEAELRRYKGILSM